VVDHHQHHAAVLRVLFSTDPATSRLFSLGSDGGVCIYHSAAHGFLPLRVLPCANVTEMARVMARASEESLATSKRGASTATVSSAVALEDLLAYNSYVTVSDHLLAFVGAEPHMVVLYDWRSLTERHRVDIRRYATSGKNFSGSASHRGTDSKSRAAFQQPATALSISAADWQTAIGAIAFAPASGTAEELLVITHDQRVLRLHPETGALLWQTALPSSQVNFHRISATHTMCPDSLMNYLLESSHTGAQGRD